MASRHIEVTINGETHHYPVPPKVEVRFEKTMKMALQDLKTNTDAHRLAHMAAQNAGVEEKFDDWIEDVEEIVWEKGPAPLDEIQSSGGSQPLPSPQA